MSTSNDTNKVTAVAAEGAEIEIKLGDTEVENGSSPAWTAGENVLTITVTNGDAEKVYTVTVTKS